MPVPVWPLLKYSDPELDTILFLHIVAGILLTGGVAALLVLVQRGRGGDGASAQTRLADAHAVYRLIAMPGAVLVGILGLVLLFRLDSAGILDAGGAVWAHTSGVLWIVSLGLLGLTARALRRGEGTARERLASPALFGMILVNVVVLVVTLVLMIYQPFKA